MFQPVFIVVVFALSTSRFGRRGGREQDELRGRGYRVENHNLLPNLAGKADRQVISGSSFGRWGSRMALRIVVSSQR
jgi:hypothetical protein